MRSTLLCVLIGILTLGAAEGPSYDHWRVILNGDPEQQGFIGTVGERVVRMNIHVKQGDASAVYLAYNPLEEQTQSILVPEALGITGIKVGGGLKGNGKVVPLILGKRAFEHRSTVDFSCGIIDQGGALSGSLTIAGTSYTVSGTVLRGAQAAKLGAFDPEASWPQVGGPHGDYSASIQTKTPVITTDFASWRLQWISQDVMPASASGARMLVMPSGGSAGPILHRGRIYQYYYLPAGPIIDEGLAKERDPVAPPWNRTLADDVMVAIDPATGATLWRTVVPLAGATYAPHKPEMQGHTMVGDGERVYAIGSAGMVYGLDAATGKILWQAPSPLDARVTEAVAAMAKSGTRADRFVRPNNRNSGHSPVVAKGVLIVPSLMSTGLAGMDGATGKVLWKRDNILAKCASPLVWKSDKGEMVIAVGRTTGEKSDAKDMVACIDPATGTDLWVSEPLGSMPAGATLNGDRIFVNIGSASTGTEARLACMKLTTSGLQPLWQASDAAKGGIWAMAAGSQATCIGDRVYCHINPESGKVGIGVFDASTGDVRKVNLPWTSYQETAGVGMQGLLIWPEEWQHGKTSPFVFDGEGNTVGQWSLPAIHVPVTPYNVPSAGSPILVDGRYILRASDGLHCYDVRAKR